MLVLLIETVTAEVAHLAVVIQAVDMAVVMAEMAFVTEVDIMIIHHTFLAEEEMVTTVERCVHRGLVVEEASMTLDPVVDHVLIGVATWIEATVTTDLIPQDHHLTSMTILHAFMAEVREISHPCTLPVMVVVLSVISLAVDMVDTIVDEVERGVSHALDPGLGAVTSEVVAESDEAHQNAAAVHVLPVVVAANQVEDERESVVCRLVAQNPLHQPHQDRKNGVYEGFAGSVCNFISVVSKACTALKFCIPAALQPQFSVIFCAV